MVWLEKNTKVRIEEGESFFLSMLHHRGRLLKKPLKGEIMPGRHDTAVTFELTQVKSDGSTNVITNVVQV